MPVVSTLLARIDVALKEGRETAEKARRFLAASVPAGGQGQGEDLLPGLLCLASERVELSTGYRYLFENGPGLVSLIAAVVEQERQYCRGLRFQIALELDRGPITLDVSGLEAAQAFLAALGAPDREKAREFARKLGDERRKAWIQKAG